jgi:predicted nucleotidyltransferase
MLFDDKKVDVDIIMNDKPGMRKLQFLEDLSKLTDIFGQEVYVC